jgi:hypothetical protein
MLEIEQSLSPHPLQVFGIKSTKKEPSPTGILFIKFQNPRKRSPLLLRCYKPPRAPPTQHRAREDHAAAVEARIATGPPPS